jgi:hypothetical protein
MSKKEINSKSSIVLLKSYNDYLKGMEKIYRGGFDDATYQDINIWSSVVSLLRDYEAKRNVDIDSLNEYFNDDESIAFSEALFTVGKNLIDRGATLKL